MGPAASIIVVGTLLLLINVAFFVPDISLWTAVILFSVPIYAGTAISYFATCDNRNMPIEKHEVQELFKDNTENLSAHVSTEEDGVPVEYYAIAAREDGKARITITKKKDSNKEITMDEIFTSVESADCHLRAFTKFTINDFK